MLFPIRLNTGRAIKTIIVRVLPTLKMLGMSVTVKKKKNLILVGNGENDDDSVTAAVREVSRLTSRIRNNRRSMSQSSSLFNPVAYQTNVLNATKNCVVEWKAILNRYDDIPDDLVSTTSLALFELIQQSLQSGPLSGAKPGYFKRCGSDVAVAVLQFLQSMSPLTLRFTDNQVRAISKWTQNAKAAAESGTGASTSVQKRVSLAQKKRDSRHKKKATN